jgi:deazaflavin-dependent nitroreductase family protein
MPIPNRIRYFNKRFTNRILALIAGKKASPIALVQHEGRRSGKRYQTPVMAEKSGESFIFALTYGTGVDWYQNVLAAGFCRLHWRGREYPLAHPEVLSPSEGLAAYPNPQRAVLKRLKNNDFFRMTVDSSGKFA